MFSVIGVTGSSMKWEMWITGAFLGKNFLAWLEITGQPPNFVQINSIRVEEEV